MLICCHAACLHREQLLVKRNGATASPHAKDLLVEFNTPTGLVKADPPDILGLLQQAGSPAEAQDPIQRRLRMDSEAAVQQVCLSGASKAPKKLLVA